ncbi:MAG TPA: energy transducer TonB [Dongiaceae bacterium]|nr:energy transducer TonB [Dongiaceae bacterium]
MRRTEPRARRRLTPFSALVALAVLAVPGAPPPAGATPRQQAAAPSGAPDLFAAGLADFLEWAHPAAGDCGAVDRIEVITRWSGGLRVRFEVPCAAARRRLEAILETREGPGVWQVSAGFESEEGPVLEALRSGRMRIPLEGAIPPAPPEVQAGLSPPPANPGDPIGPLAAVAPPRAVRQSPPLFPEEAGRARLIGDARVQMLIDIGPDGVPGRARTLRGPDPDLGMRAAAVAAVATWRFDPATLDRHPVRYFAPIELTFNGLPPESRFWAHRALFDLEVLVFPESGRADEAVARLKDGRPIEEVSPEQALDSDWGLMAAAELPAPVRAALHEARIGAWAGPIRNGGEYWVTRKRGEVYYAILPTAAGGDAQYQVVHQRGVPDSPELRTALDSDVLDYMAERTRRDYMNEAARLMGLRQSRLKVGQLIVHTDVLGGEESRLVGDIVDAAHRAHQQFWAGLTTLRLFREPVLVYAFARRRDHQAVQALWASHAGPAAPQSSGEYIPASRILAFPCESAGGHLPLPVVVHESIHMLNYERVYPPNVQPSRWFEEGLANYFGLSQIDSQLNIDAGVIRRSGTIVTGGARVQFDPRLELLEQRRRNHVSGPIALNALIGSAPTDPLWTGNDSARAYGAAWTLVHFLLNADHGRHAAAFRQYAAREARGEGGPAAFHAIFGDDLTALESAWHDYEETL